GEIFELNAFFHSSDWSMAGVVEAATFAALPVSCAPAENTSNPHAAIARGSRDTFRITPYLHGLQETGTQYLRFQRKNPMKRATPTTANPRYTCQPCSKVADAIAPRAERI